MREHQPRAVLWFTVWSRIPRNLSGEKTNKQNQGKEISVFKFILIFFSVTLKSPDSYDYSIQCFPNLTKRKNPLLSYLNLLQSHPHYKCRSREQFFSKNVHHQFSDSMSKHMAPWEMPVQFSKSIEARPTAGILPAYYLLC